MPGKLLVRKKYKSKKVSDTIKKYVHKAITHDKIRKQHYFAWPSQALSTSVGTTFLLNSTQVGGGVFANSLYRGDSLCQREGDEILIYEVTFRFGLNISGVLPIASGARALLFVDRQPDGTAYTTSELITTNTSAVTVRAPFRYDMRKKWSILQDKHIEVVSQWLQTAAGGQYKECVVQHRFKTPLRTVYYSTAESNTITELSINALYCTVFAENAAVGILNPTVSLTFTDA